MAEIKIKTGILEQSVTSLKSLEQKCRNFDTKSPSTVGGGVTVSELEDIAAMYKKLNRTFTDLVGDTAAFMTNVKNSYVSSDSKAATKIEG